MCDSTDELPDVARADTSSRDSPRRPIRSRQTRWASAVARRLTQAGVKPNWISVSSVVFAAGTCAALLALRWTGVAWVQAILLACAIVGIVLRLLANLFDGMVAVEGGMKTAAGGIYNDFPDRLADSLILVGAGYAVAEPGWAAGLGWSAALLAALTAYVRFLGASAGATQWFGGPMAKQHRMVVMVAACLAGMVECWWGGPRWSLVAGLAVIVLGCIATLARRLRRIIRELNDA